MGKERSSMVGAMFRWRAVAVVLAISLLAMEGEAHQLGAEVTELSEDYGLADAPVRARLGEDDDQESDADGGATSAAKSKLDAAMSEALKTGESKDVYAMMEASHNVKVAKAEAAATTAPEEAGQAAMDQQVS